MADRVVPGGRDVGPVGPPARGRSGVRAGGVPPGAGESAGISLADLPDWVIEQVDREAFPTRMARRRALEQAHGHGAWRPDDQVTPPLLVRVRDELTDLLDRRFEPVFDLVADAEPLTRRDELPTADLLPRTPVRPRRARWRLVAAGGTALLAAAALTVALTSGRGPGSSTAPVAAAPTQQVVALALGDGGRLTGISLLAAGTGAAQQVLVPSRLLLDVPGAGRMPVAQSLAPGPQAPGAAVADALDVRVAGTWLLDSTALATLVDSLGGLRVDVDVDVPRFGGPGTAQGGEIVVASGSGQRLTGAQAAAYAGLLVDDEPEASRLARQERVVTALLAGLPADPADRRAQLVGLAGAPSGTLLDTVVRVTGLLAEPARSGALGSTVVPTRDIDTGGAVTAYGLDDVAAAAMVQARLPGAVLAVPPGGRLTVLVQNGVGTPGLGDAARSRLVSAGLKYVGGGNVDGFGVTTSVVLIADGSSAHRAQGAAVAGALGLPGTALRITDTAPTVADIVVVLGQDFTDG